MRARGRYRIVVGAGLLLAMVGLAPVSAHEPKTELCHRDDDGSFRLITVAPQAADKHLERHGDGIPGGEVPGAPGYRFEADCSIGPAFFVRAYATDSTGAERPIAQLEDTNGNGGIDNGDLVRTFEYPLGFGGTAFGEFNVKVHEVGRIDWVSGDFEWVKACINDCNDGQHFYWSSAPGTGQYSLETYQERKDPSQSGGGLNAWIDYFDGRGDHITVVEGRGWSDPTDTSYVFSTPASDGSSGDAEWFEVEFRLP